MRFGGLLIDETFRGLGYGRKAIELIEHKSFNEYNAKCLQLGVYDFNENAMKLYESMDYKVTETKEDLSNSKWNSYTMEKCR